LPAEQLATNDPSRKFRQKLYHKANARQQGAGSEIASRAAFREALQKGHSALLEPVMRVEVVTREDCTGPVIGDLNSRRGQILGQDRRDNANVINATANVRIREQPALDEPGTRHVPNAIRSLRPCTTFARRRSAISSCDRNACLNARRNAVAVASPL